MIVVLVVVVFLYWCYSLSIECSSTCILHLTLEKKMSKNQRVFKLKKINQRSLLLIAEKMNKKKSAGVDGLSQKQLIQGVSTLAIPLTALFNRSIEEGKFPECWKEALITPVLKNFWKS